jgi:parallel beta-helix repeat protein
MISMKKTHSFTTLLIVGILLFVLVSSCLSVAITNQDAPVYQPSRRTTITVDDDGDGDYTRIQDAVNNASPGDIIEVYSGRYYEHDIRIYLNGLTIRGIPFELGDGNDSGKPFVDGEGIEGEGLFHIHDTNGVTIDGFHIENGGVPPGDWYTMSASIRADFANHTTITNNTITLNGHYIGIALYHGDGHNIIRDNQIVTIGYVAITIDNSDYNMVIHNYVNGCKAGIVVISSNYNYISENVVSNCRNVSVNLWGADFNTVSHNNFKDTIGGLYVADGYKNYISHNNFINNSQNNYFLEGGIFRCFLTPSNNKWVANYWDDWQGHGPKVIRGDAFIQFIIPVIPPVYVEWDRPSFSFDWHPAKEPYDIPDMS